MIKTAECKEKKLYDNNYLITKNIINIKIIKILTSINYSAIVYHFIELRNNNIKQIYN